MDVAALASDIAKFEADAASLESWLTVWIVAVVVGLVIEMWVVVDEHFNERPRSRKKLAFHVIGPVLITVGVTGELAIHVMSGHINTELRNANRTQVALAQTEAKEAGRQA